MPSTTKAKARALGPRVSGQTEQFLSTTFSSRHSGSEYVLEAFSVLYKRALAELRGRFSAGELSIIVDVSNASMLMPAMAGQHLIPQVEDGISLDELDFKWGVDGAPFLARLRELTSFQTAALEVWGRAFWEGKYEKKGALEKYVQTLAGGEK